ncbi:MAG: hypothetical protein L0207_00885 [Chlamydiae bacterium]|nr:hypothetical protein [Chlamydiota bacterium]
MKISTIFLLFILIIAIVLFFGWSRIPDMVANNLSKKLKVAVSIRSIRILPATISVSDLEIGNPAEYTALPKAFSSEKISIKAPITRYMSENVTIEEIDINNIYLGLAFDSASATTGNWTVIMSNYKKEANLGNQKEVKERSVLIKKLILRNIATSVIFLKEGGSVKKLPIIDKIELTNITSEGGLPMDQLLNSVLGEMLKSVFLKQNLKNMLKDIFDTPEKAVDTLLKPFKGMFNCLPKKIPIESPEITTTHADHHIDI